MQERSSFSQVTVSRVERGEQRLAAAQVQEWLDVLDARGQVRERVAALNEAAHNETRAWSELLDDAIVELQGVAQGRETTSRLVRNCQLTIVPGLLQTAEYARLLIPQMDPARAIDHAAAVARRVERQQILYREGGRFEFLIAEQALLWSPGVDVMPAQLDRLLSLATLATVDVRILPMRRSAVPTWHSFTYFEPADQGADAYVTTELLHGDQVVVEPAAVQAYDEQWKLLWAEATTGDASTALIEGARNSGVRSAHRTASSA